MATAPRPGAVRAEQSATSRFRIRVKDRTLELQNNISMQEKIALRLATGMPFEAFWAGEERIGEDSICVLWWLARRANGEPQLAWAQAAQEWPSPLGEDDLEAEIIDDDGEPTDDPEGSGPGS